jgi:hypothetical protein
MHVLGLKTDDWKGLWSVLWRVLILAPVIWILGLVLLTLVLAGFVLPPFYAIIAFISGDGYYGMASLIGWLVLLRFGRPVLRWTLQGFEYASI